MGYGGIGESPPQQTHQGDLLAVLLAWQLEFAGDCWEWGYSHSGCPRCSSALCVECGTYAEGRGRGGGGGDEGRESAAWPGRTTLIYSYMKSK